MSCVLILLKNRSLKCGVKPQSTKVINACIFIRKGKVT